MKLSQKEIEHQIREAYVEGQDYQEIADMLQVNVDEVIYTLRAA